MLLWYLEDDSDKIEINHTDTVSGAMTINWLSGVSDVTKTRIIKSSLIIPMTRILHININDPTRDDDEQLPKETIDK